MDEDAQLQLAIMESLETLREAAARAGEASPPALGSPVHLNSRSPSPEAEQGSDAVRDASVEPPVMDWRDAATLVYSPSPQPQHGPAQRSPSVQPPAMDWRDAATIVDTPVASPEPAQRPPSVDHDDGDGREQEAHDSEQQPHPTGPLTELAALEKEVRGLYYKAFEVRDKLRAVYKRCLIECKKRGQETPSLGLSRVRFFADLDRDVAIHRVYKQQLLDEIRNAVKMYNERFQYLVDNGVQRINNYKFMDIDIVLAGAGCSAAAAAPPAAEDDGATSTSSSSMASMAQSGVDNALERKRGCQGRGEQPLPKKPRKVESGECCICTVEGTILVSCKSTGRHHYCRECFRGYVDSCSKSGKVMPMGNPEVPCCVPDCTGGVRVYVRHLVKDGWKNFEAAQVAALKRQWDEERLAEQMAAAAAADANGVQRLRAQFEIVLAYGLAAFCPTCHRRGVKDPERCIHIDCMGGCPGNYCYCCGINRDTATGGTGGCRCDYPRAMLNRVDHPALRDARVLPGEDEFMALQAEFHLLRTAHFLHVFVDYIGADSWNRLLEAYPNLLRRVVYGRDLTPEKIRDALTYPIARSELAKASVTATISRMMVAVSK